MKSYLLLFLLVLAANVVAQQPSTPAPQPAQHAPRPKTQAEANDYKAAFVTTGGAASEKAANDFAAKYPQSELRESLYERAMHEYQTENAPNKVVAMAQKVLELDPTNSVALVITAGALSDSLKENDPDQQKVTQILTDANLALQTIDTAFVPPGQVTPEQLTAFKNMLKAGAHSALGVTNLKMGNYAGAETELKAAIELNKARPDPDTYYQLALAQDRQKKYPEALASVNEGLKYAASDPEETRLLNAERDKVKKEAGSDQGVK